MMCTTVEGPGFSIRRFGPFNWLLASMQLALSEQAACIDANFFKNTVLAC